MGEAAAHRTSSLCVPEGTLGMFTWLAFHTMVVFWNYLLGSGSSKVMFAYCLSVLGFVFLNSCGLRVGSTGPTCPPLRGYLSANLRSRPALFPTLSCNSRWGLGLRPAPCRPSSSPDPGCELRQAALFSAGLSRVGVKGDPLIFSQGINELVFPHRHPPRRMERELSPSSQKQTQVRS